MEITLTQIFISYSRRDLTFVEGLASDLKKVGFEVWYDYLRLRGGERWRIEIENALKASQCVITVLSPDSVVSEWVEREFLFATSLDRKVIPLLYRDCELPLNYMDLNYIDVRGENYRRNFNKILDVLKVNRAAHSRSIASPIGIRPSNGQIQASQGSLLDKSYMWIPTLSLLFCLALCATVAGYQYLLRPILQNSDGDRDGLTYIEEIEYGCGPNKQDSDNDGLIDAKEKESRTYCDRFDSDNDGLSDGEEVFVMNTDPVKADTDGDGIIDSQDQAPKEMPTATAGTSTSGSITQTFTVGPSTPLPATLMPSIPTLTPTSTQTPTHTPTLTFTPTPSYTPTRVGNGRIYTWVYLDTDNNGSYEGGDTPLSATLQLYAGTSCSGSVLTTVGQFFGGYSFLDLQAGTYCAKVVDHSVDSGGICTLVPRGGDNIQVYTLVTRDQTITDKSGFPYVCQ